MCRFSECLPGKSKKVNQKSWMIYKFRPNKVTNQKSIALTQANNQLENIIEEGTLLKITQKK